MSLCKKAALLPLLIGSFLHWMTMTPTRAAILTGAIGSHDPSRMIDCDGTYYIYSTGGRMAY